MKFINFLFILLLFRQIDAQAGCISDSLLRVHLQDSAKVFPMGKTCGNCAIEITDTDNVVLKKFYFENGNVLFFIENIYYSNDRSKLYSQNFYEHDKLSETRDQFFLDDSSSYHSVSYFDNGKASEEGNKRKGLKDGTWNQYFETGSLNITCKYIKGIKNGKFREYDKNGKIITEGEYKDDKMSGKWSEYNSEGNVVRQDEYINGELQAPVIKEKKIKEKKLTREERIQKQLNEFNLNESDFKGCIYFISIHNEDTLRKITVGEVVKIDCNAIRYLLIARLKAIKENVMYVYTTRGGLEDEIYKISISDIEKIGFSSVEKAVLKSVGMGVLGAYGGIGPAYKMVNMKDTKHRIDFKENCK